MNYFDSDMSKSTNTVYFDWKTVIYIYVCGKCRTQYMLPMEKSVTFTGAGANEIIEPTPLIVIDTDCIGSCKSNYHTIMSTTTPL
jgi:hypothetical protein